MYGGAQAMYTVHPLVLASTNSIEAVKGKPYVDPVIQIKTKLLQKMLVLQNV